MAWLRVMAALCALGLLGGTAVATEASSPPDPPRQSFFGTVEIRRANLAPFPKWTGMLARHIAERVTANDDCMKPPITLCVWREWQDFIRSQRGMPLRQQLDNVNTFMNRHPYVIDLINWGVEDYWATPGEFLRKDGDCEDYAIAKFFTLRQLGYDDLDVRVVVVQDLNLKIAHAVLVVHAEGKVWILDNQIKQVVEETTIRHYRPIYSVSERSWWLHRAPQTP